MSSKLLVLVNNLSEIYSEASRGCKEIKKTKSVCDLIGLKNNKLHYKCKECKKRWLTPIKKFPNTYEFCSNNTRKLIFLIKKVLTLMNT